MTTVQAATVTLVPPLASMATAGSGAVASTTASTTSREPADTVELSPAALQALHDQISPANQVSADDAAEDCRAVAESVRGLADHLKGLSDFLNDESMGHMRVALGDEGAEQWAAQMRQHIADTEKTLAEYSSYVGRTYGVSGALPTKGEDGTWSSGAFTLSRSGQGYVVRAGSNGTVEVSRNGGAFQAWTPPQDASRSAGTAASQAAQVALATLERIRTTGDAGA